MVNIDIRNQDARDLLKSLSSESIDLIVTDPPYPVISGGKSDGKDNRPSGILMKNDGKIFTENNIHISEWIYECYRVLKDQTHLYVMVNFLNLEEYLSEIRKAGFDIHSLLMWEKDNCTPSRWYMKNGEYTIFARKGKAKPINNNGSKMIHKFNNPRNKIHPTEKPIDLISMYIENSSNKGDLVLDPFVGGGSCPVSCQLTNRNFIGSELDFEYYTIACNRLKMNNNQSKISEFFRSEEHTSELQSH